MGRFRGALAALLLLAAPAAGQVSSQSVRVFGTQATSDDSIRVPVDGTAADVGAGAFTVEQWLRCTDAANEPLVANYRPADGETAAFDWIDGRIFLDRDVNGLPSAGGGDWGAAIHRPTADGASVVRFGAQQGSNTPLTIQGSSDVCDDTWHHVAVGRDGGNRLFVIVDGTLDYQSTGTVTGSLAYPNGQAGGPGGDALVWGTEKHGFQLGYRGYLDELRVWSVARSAAQVSAARLTVLSASTTGLELYLRLEEGDRAVNPEPLADATGRNTGAVLFDGVAGNGEWAETVPGTPVSTSTSSTSSTTSSSSSTSSSSTSSTSSSTAPLASTSSSTTSSSSTSTSSTGPLPTTTSSTTEPGPAPSTTTSTTSSTLASLPAPTTTSTTLAAGCASDAACADLDPCTLDACLAGACTHALPAGLAGATCELERLAAGPLCAAEPPPGRIARAIARRLDAAARLLDAAAVAGPEKSRGRRKIAAALRKVRAAERRIESGLEKARLTPACGAELLGSLGRARSALVPADAVRLAPPFFRAT